MDTDALGLFYWPKDRLRLTVRGDRSYPTVRPVWAAPLTQPGRWLSLVDAKGDEIVLIEDIKQLPRESLEAVRRELRRRYLAAEVQRVVDCRQEFGTTYWRVDTNRGERELVTQSLQENAQWLSDTHLVLVDVDGNRFDIPDTTNLDARSRSLLHGIL